MPSTDAKTGQATTGTALQVDEVIRSASNDVLKAAATDPTLSEDLALALLTRPDAPSEALEQLARNGRVMKSRKVKLALVGHPRTPRHLSLPILRHLFTFDLMRVTLMPVIPADIKRAAEEALVNRVETIPTGERLSLARRASGRVAGVLLFDPEPQVIHAALENSRLTEASVIQCLARHDTSAALVETVCRHPKWSLRHEIRIALLRNEKTPLARAVEFARALSPGLVREIMQGSRLPGRVKSRVLKELEQRGSAGCAAKKVRPT
jgi:hypothetical protein